MGDLPGMPVRIGEDAGVAAPERLGSRTSDLRAGGRRRSQDRVDLVRGPNVVRKRDATPAASGEQHGISARTAACGRHAGQPGAMPFISGQTEAPAQTDAGSGAAAANRARATRAIEIRRSASTTARILRPVSSRPATRAGGSASIVTLPGPLPEDRTTRKEDEMTTDPQVALVTGGSRGIGRATAESLLGRGLTASTSAAAAPIFSSPRR